MKPNREPVVIIETIDGRAYAGPTLEAAVRAMRASAWACTEPTLRGYMHGVARRVLMWNKAPVRTTNITDFCADMEAAGMLIVRQAA